LSRVFFFSAQATQSYYDLDYRSGDWLVFGREADGLPKEILKAHASQCVKIPFPGKVRSFNLGNAVAMALGEGLRQLEL
jgi:tRNA (cytidine/uridine-2'-O-)-methyltransferase